MGKVFIEIIEIYKQKLYHKIKLNKYMNKIKEFELDANAIFELSVVDNPASKAKGLFFSATSKDNTEKQDKMTFNVMNADATEHTVSGVFFPADKKIERYDENGNLYLVSMTKEAVFSMFKKYLRQGGSYITVEHNDSECKYFPIVESWIIKNESTESPVYWHSLQDLGLDLATAPIGTAMISIYINDTEFWEKYILNGKFSFSIGGYFTLTPVDTVTETSTTENVVEEDFSSKFHEDFHKRIIESNEYKFKHSFGSVYKYLDKDNKPITDTIKHTFNGKTYDLSVHGGWIFGFTESEMETNIEDESENEIEVINDNDTQNETIDNTTTIEVETAQEEVEIPKNSELFAEEFKHKTINTKTPNLPKKGRVRTF